MSKTYNRREFIKISGTGIGSAVAASALLQLADHSVRADDFSPDDKIERFPTCCDICFWQCAGWVYTRNGEPWKIIGNENDHLSNGRLCPRGTGGLGAYLDEDRLKTPLIRTADRGKQVFKEASWEEAFNHIAEKMKVIKEKYGPESIALFTHGSGGAFFKTLLKAYGSDNVTAPSYAQCRGPREEAYLLTFGEGIESHERIDIKNSRCIVLIGSHIGENMHNSQLQEFSEANGNGASIITVDPRYSVAASKSKYWLPIKPGTDLALLLAWIHVLIYEDLYDKDYIARYAYGFEELKQAVKDTTPEWAYPITTIQPGMIYETAREMAKNAPATFIHPGRFSVWYGDDTQRIRASAIVNALLGCWGRRGGFYYPTKAKLGHSSTPPYPKPAKTWRDAFTDKFPLAHSAPASAMCEISIPTAEQDAMIKGWIVYSTNLIHTLPEPKKTMDAIQSLELLVVVDTMPAEITGWADVVLPECTYLERYDDIRDASGRFPSIALRMPAFKPKNNTKPGWWIAKEWAKYLGLEAYFPWNDMEEYLSHSLSAYNVSLDEMKKVGVKNFPNENPIYFAEGEDFEFPTPTGKIELYSHQLAEMGFDPVPKYTPPEEPPEGFYRLLFGRAPMHTFGRTANNPILTDIKEENEVWINPKVAKNWGIKHGQYIVLVNQDGVASNKIRAKVTERIRYDCVYMVHGFGHRDQRMKRCYLKGASDAELITRVKLDPIMGGTGMRVNFVTFRTEVG